MTETKLRKVLIVDDDPSLRKLLRRILTTLSVPVEISEAEDGAEAIKVLQQSRFDLILLDVIMPKLDGLATLQWIRENAETKNLPVFILSGEKTAEAIYRGRDKGVTHYLTKPFEVDNLAALIESYFDGDLAS